MPSKSLGIENIFVFGGPNGNYYYHLYAYQMTIHKLEANTSSSCAQFCSQELVEDQTAMDKLAKSIVKNRFFMGGCLFSVPTFAEAVFFAQQVSTALNNRSFNLTKWLSNTPEVLKRLSQKKLA